MKTYESLKALTTKQRANDLITCCETSVSRQKQVAKCLVAMVAAGDCKAREMSKYADKLTGMDIRREMQNVYELVRVFEAVIDGSIKITEEQFDSLDGAKLALLSPFLRKEELKAKLPEAVEAAKNGTAKDIRDLKPKAEKAKPESETPKGPEIPVGFLATDITDTDALVTSKQFKARIKSDMTRAMDTRDETAMDAMKAYFGTMFELCCRALGEHAVDAMEAYVGNTAKAAAGKVIEAESVAA